MSAIDSGANGSDSQNLFLRNDTIFGVCEAVGRDLGFNPNWLRVLLCAGFILSPMIVAAAYLGLGAVVLATRLLFPSIAVPASAPAAEAKAPANSESELPVAA